jgi:hypothetical protein
MSVIYLFGGNGSGIRQANRIVNYCYNSSNPYKCLGISNTNPEPKPIDPNDYANLNYILSTNGYLTSDYSVAKKAKNKPFWELLFQSSETHIYYDYVSTTDSVQNIDADNYNWNVLEPGVSAIIRNDKRYFMYNQSYVLKENISTVLFPPTKYIPLIDKNGTELGISSPLKLTTTLTSLSSGRYIESIINRTSAFVYEPDNTVFMLIDTINKKIYAMQTWTNNTPTTEVPPPDFFTVSPGNLLDPNTNFGYYYSILQDETIIGVENVIPPGWCFTQCYLGSESMIVLMANPEKNWYAKVVTDGLGNNYQYIREEEAPFLYDIFK